MITVTIARKEHMKPSDIEHWSLPDITLMYASYIEEGKQMEEANKEMKMNSPG